MYLPKEFICAYCKKKVIKRCWKGKFCCHKCYTESNKGKKLTQEVKDKISNSHKGQYPFWLDNYRGQTKGKKMSEETRKKMSESHKGKKLSKKHRENIGKSNKGKCLGKTWKEMYGANEEKIRKIRKEVTRLENNPMWKGGKSYENYSYDFNKDFKLKINKRDSNTCQICGADGKCVHHIDYDKKNTREDNCVTLCRVCHSRTNANRDYWEWQLKVFMKLFKGADYNITWVLSEGGSDEIPKKYGRVLKL